MLIWYFILMFNLLNKKRELTSVAESVRCQFVVRVAPGSNRRRQGWCVYCHFSDVCVRGWLVKDYWLVPAGFRPALIFRDWSMSVELNPAFGDFKLKKLV